VLAFVAAGEAAHTAQLPQRVKAIAPPGKQLVRVGLVTDVPHDFVARAFKNVVQGDGKFDDAQVAGEVTAGFAHRVDEHLSDFFRQQRKLIERKLLEIIGTVDLIEQ
jgi:hypothetical protein